jgi:hypothetical protein
MRKLVLKIILCFKKRFFLPQKYIAQFDDGDFESQQKLFFAHLDLKQISEVEDAATILDKFSAFPRIFPFCCLFQALLK